MSHITFIISILCVSSLFSSLSFADNKEQAARVLVEELKDDDAKMRRTNLDNVHEFFESSSVSRDKRLASLALGINYIESNYRLAIQYLSSAEVSSRDKDDLLSIIRYYLALAKYKGGAYREAADLGQSLLSKGLGLGWERSVYELLLESFFEAGDYEKVLATFEEFTKKHGVSRRQENILFLVAQSLERQGRHLQAIKVFEELMPPYPATESSRYAFKRLQDYSCKGAGLATPYYFSTELLQRLSRNVVLESGLREFLIAIAYSSLRREDGTVKVLTAQERVDFYFSVRLYDEALREALPLYEEELAKGKSPRLASLTFLLGRIHTRRMDPLQASRYFSDFVAKFPGHPEKPRVLELLADSYKYLGANAAAAELYAEAAKPQFTSHLKWERFWNTFRGGDFKAALALLENKGAVETRDGDDLQTKLYWHARTLEKLNRTKESQDIYREILRDYGDGFYADIITKKFPEIAGEINVAAKPSLSSGGGDGMRLAARILFDKGQDFEKNRELRLVDELLKVGLKESAKLQMQSLSWKDFSQQDAFAAMSRVSWVLNDYQPSRRIRYRPNSSLRSMPTDWWQLVNHQRRYSEEWRVFYPFAFEKVINSVEKRIKTSPYLLLSIMRSESFYNSEARSIVGARGLMQIMPYTGVKIAQIINDKSFNVLELNSPEISISYGGYYLDRLLRYYQNNPYLAVAAYNAGPHAVNFWLKSCQTCAVDEFVELIPYRETRRYVREVMRNYAHYQRVYGVEDKLPALPALPSALPQNEDVF